MNFSDYKAIILRNKFVRITIIYDLLCCFMLMSALFGLDAKRNFFSVMFAYAVPVMCSAIFGMYIVSMSSNRKICLLFPSLTYHLSLVIYALLANDIPAMCLSILSFAPLLFFAIHIFTGKFEKLCTVFCTAFIIFLAAVCIAITLVFLFASFKNTGKLQSDVYSLIENNLSQIQVTSFSACALAPLIASYISAIRAVYEEENRTNGTSDHPSQSILS